MKIRMLAGVGVIFALSLPAQAYYYTMNTWFYWQATPVTVNVTSVATSPESVSGNTMGYLTLGGPGVTGDFGNLYMPLTTNAGWVPGHTFVLGFDIKVLVGNANAGTNFLTRPGYGPDGQWTTANFSGISDGLWHHVAITMPMPQGYDWQGTPGSGTTAPGTHDFLSLNGVAIDLFRNGGPYDNVSYLKALVDNITIVDQTTLTDYAANGSFSLFPGAPNNPSAQPNGYTHAERAEIWVVTPEPTSLALLTLAGVTLARRRR